MDKRTKSPVSSTPADGKRAKPTPYEAAARFLGVRMRTVEEVLKHLRDKGYAEDEIRETIRELKELKYLDDEYYVKVYAEYAFGKGRASKRIANELGQKGIAQETVRNALEDYMYEAGVDERALAYDAAKRAIQIELSGSMKEYDQKMRMRIARKLDQRGFETGDIFSVLSELAGEFGGRDEDEYID